MGFLQTFNIYKKPLTYEDPHLLKIGFFATMVYTILVITTMLVFSLPLIQEERVYELRKNDPTYEEFMDIQGSNPVCPCTSARIRLEELDKSMDAYFDSISREFDIVFEATSTSPCDLILYLYYYVDGDKLDYADDRIYWYYRLVIAPAAERCNFVVLRLQTAGQGFVNTAVPSRTALPFLDFQSWVLGTIGVFEMQVAEGFISARTVSTLVRSPDGAFAFDINPDEVLYEANNGTTSITTNFVDDDDDFGGDDFFGDDDDFGDDDVFGDDDDFGDDDNFHHFDDDNDDFDDDVFGNDDDFGDDDNFHHFDDDNDDFDHHGDTCASNPVGASFEYTIFGHRSFVESCSLGTTVMRANMLSWNAAMLDAYRDYLEDDADVKTIDDFSVWDAPPDTDGDFEDYLFEAYFYFSDRTFEQNAIRVTEDMHKEYFEKCQPSECRYTEHRRATLIELTTLNLGLYGGLTAFFKEPIGKIAFQLFRKRKKKVGSGISKDKASDKEVVAEANPHMQQIVDIEKKGEV